ncbi:MAG TPA: family 16 glycoside hydrolase [Planctomycetota bacterium]|nr:family 16 glycoside hydrolase [Planctomycetota bacterium]
MKALLLLLSLLALQDKKPAPATDPEKAGPDYRIQGEYANGSTGAQVVALGDDKFDVYILAGGLPGAGWDEKTKTRASAKTEGGKTTVSGDWAGEIADGVLSGAGDVQLKRVVRTSPTMGAKAPEGAVVLFDGTSGEEILAGGKPAKVVDGVIWASGTGGFFSKRKFGSIKLHVEFMLSYMPYARGQGRSNSGVYPAGRHECQVLDSFGLKGENNECGGIYTIAKPAVNMCLPPLQWQTYDIEYHLASDGKPATMSVLHNGVKIHENVELKKHTTSAPDNGADDTPGPLHLQDHGNPVAYRNIWLVELK